MKRRQHKTCEPSHHEKALWPCGATNVPESDPAHVTVEANRVLVISFWKTREDDESYRREQYNSVRETLRSLLEGEPVVRTFDVHTSTGHKITARQGGVGTAKEHHQKRRALVARLCARVGTML